MEGKEAIVGKIISDAEERAENARKDARARAESLVADAQRRMQEQAENDRRLTEKEAAERIARRETIAQLDCRKLLLTARREAVETVFARALQTLCAMDEKSYLHFMETLLERYAEEGDEVQLSEHAPVKEEELAACNVFAAKKLRFTQRGAFEGGMRLLSALCEKDLSFRALLEADRFESEREIVDVFPAEI